MKRVLILVEGQTEERFVKDVLASVLAPRDIFLTPTLLVTKRVKDGPSFKGGVTHFAKFENDLRRLLTDTHAFVTTMLDYYALPQDFPGMATRPHGASARLRARHVEEAVDAHFGRPARLRTFLALHEFEAWLFADDESLPAVMNRPDRQPAFAAIKAGFDSPETINDGPLTAPSKRLEVLFPGYRKRLHGPTAAARIGVDEIRATCPHFANWLADLERTP
jgi:hypothetical protein